MASRALMVLTAAGALLASPAASRAQAELGVGLDFAISTLRAKAATADSIAADGLGAHISFTTTRRRLFLLGGELNFYRHSDRVLSTVGTTQGIRRSGATILTLGGAAGVMPGGVPLGSGDTRLTMSVMAGYSFVVMANVNFGNCVDCPERDVDIDGGAFGEPTIWVRGERLRFGAGWRRFLSGDIESVLLLRFGWS